MPRITNAIIGFLVNMHIGPSSRVVPWPPALPPTFKKINNYDHIQSFILY